MIKFLFVVVLQIVTVGCSSGNNPEGLYVLEALDVEIQDPVKGYLEFKKDGELVAHWLVPESVIQVLSGYRETPEEKRHQTKGTPEHFTGAWETKGSDIALRVAGRGPSCRLAAGVLACKSGNGMKQTFRALAAGKQPEAWLKSGKPVTLPKEPPEVKGLDQVGEGALLSVKLHTDKGAATQTVRADIALKGKQEGGAVYVPKALSLQIAYPLLGDWPVATMTIRNNVTCESLKPEPSLSRAPVAFLRGRPSVQVQRLDFAFGCSSCSGCSNQVESKTLTFVAGH
jgi:hypothetical protein